MTLDTTKPSDDDKVDTIAGCIRETRSAVADAEVVTVQDLVVSLLTPIPALVDGINVITLSATAPISVSSFAVISDGSLVIVKFKDTNITLIDGTGNLNLAGDPSAPDYPAETGDIIILLYQDARWNEILRNLA